MIFDIVAVFFITFFVRLWSTLAGGGGAVMMPLLLFLGLPPDQVIATNRFSALSNIVTLIKFQQQGLVRWRLGLFLAVFAALGAGVGSFFVLVLDSAIIERGIGVLTLLSVPMFFFKKDAGVLEKKIPLTRLRYLGGAVLMTILGGLGGFFSSVGVWFSYVYIWYYGLTFLQTAATRKIAGAAMVGVSLAIFIPAGIVVWPIAISMFVGGGIGGWVSAHYAQKLGNVWIRNIFVVVILVSALKILFF